MERQSSALGNGAKVKLLCSYGGRISSRQTDRQLSYVGGETKILAVDRAVRFQEIAARLNSICNRSDSSRVCVKYQLPGEDLDALVSLIDDDDVEHMMAEHDRLQGISPTPRPARLRLFVFDAACPPPRPSPTPDYLFGFDKEYQPSAGPPPPEDFGLIPCGGVQRKAAVSECHVDTSQSGVRYHVPAEVSGVVYRNGSYAFGVAAAGGVRRPVYGVVPVLTPIRRPGV